MTKGLAGSSVLTGLIARAGFWTGHETARKADYDTYENKRLIELNKSLFDTVGFDGEYSLVFPGWVIDAIEHKFAGIDAAPFLEFIAECERNGPWIWKDPRLTLTIRAWARWLDLDKIRFLVIMREPRQSWISCTLRRQIQTYSYHIAYIDRIQRSLDSFFDHHGLDYAPIVYEDLIVNPQESLDTINTILQTQLSIADLEHIFHGSLYKRHHGGFDLTKALLIYLKNYRQRLYIDPALQ